MPESYHHLAESERCQIYALKKSGKSLRGIAKQLGRSASTISREIDRNSGGRGYRHQQAQNKASDRRSSASSVPRKMTSELWQMVEDRLQVGWSPEQISGRLRQEGFEVAGPVWIYRYVREDRQAGGMLYQHLRRRGKKPNWKGGKHAGRGHIPDRVDIADRPKIVEEKSRLGDWELDTIVGKGHQGALVSSVDRCSKYTFLGLLKTKTADELSEVLVKRMKPYKHLVHTCTADNGKEFARHKKISKELGAEVYFATPYRSCERGLNEHTNGLVREYFPKGTDFRKVSAKQVQVVEDRINNRPRKVLGYRTPAEVFGEAHGEPV